MMQSELKAKLNGLRVILGVTGSVAAYRAVDLARTLIRWGAQVRVVLTPTAAKLVSPTLFEWATGVKPLVELTGRAEHVSWAKEADALVIAPATLNTIAKISAGIADNALLALAQSIIGMGKPLLVVPAMHLSLWRQAQKSIGELERLGVHVMHPYISSDAAKMPPVNAVAWWIESRVLRGADMKGLNVLVTAGPTFEHIDDVRVLTNPSSGLMGVSIAVEAYNRGARVYLVHGPLSIELEDYYTSVIETYSVVTTEDMAEQVKRVLASRKIDLAFYAAAPADYKPTIRFKGKIRTAERPELVITLKPTIKIAREAVRVSPETKHVIFAAEASTDECELIAYGLRKLYSTGASFTVVNSVKRPGEGFRSATNRVIVIRRDGRIWRIGRELKRIIARRIIDIVIGR